MVIPVFVLLYEGFGPQIDPRYFSLILLQSIGLTLVSSALAVVISALLFTPLAYYFARNRNAIAETLADIPASIPHPIIGISLLVLDSPITPTGRFLLSIGINFFNTILGLVVALTIVSAPIYIKSMQPFFDSMNRSHENYALGLGASKMRTFISVVIPNSSHGIVTASLISMSRAMSEFGSIAIIAYYILQFPFYGVRPAPVLIYDYFTCCGLGAAVTTSAVMVVISISLMIAFRILRR